MRLNQILTESEQQELKILQEGPLGSLAKAAGRGVGNVIGGVARAAGAVKGAVKGAVQRAKSSFAAGEKDAQDALMGKKTAGAPAAAGGAAQPKSAAGGSGGATTGSGAGTADTAAQPAAGPAAAGATSAAGKSGGTATGSVPDKVPAAQTQPAADAEPAAQEKPAATKTASGTSSSALDLAQKQFGMLPDDQKKSIIALLQNDPDVKAAEQPPAAADQKPAAAKTPAAQPKPAAGGRTQGGGKVAGQLSNTPGAVRKRAQRAEKKGATTYTDTVQQKMLTPSAFGQMASNLTKQNSSVERTGQLIKESFSIFRKK